MKPAHEIYNRLVWDTEACPAFTIGYEDRFLGVLEVSRAEFEEAEIPFHRVRYFKNSTTNEVVWDRTTRLDLLSRGSHLEPDLPLTETVEDSPEEPGSPPPGAEQTSFSSRKKREILKERRKRALQQKKLDARQEKDDEERAEKEHEDEREKRLLEVEERINKFHTDIKNPSVLNCL